MDSVEVTSTYIKKLNHPIKEIRERSLQLLVAKLRSGWEFDDELAGTRELLKALLAWFNVQQPTFQKEAIELLLRTLKTKAGTYISKEIGIDNIFSILYKIKLKISVDATDAYDDLIETLCFLKAVDSEINVHIPLLNLHSQMSSESNGSSGSYYNMGLNKESSEATSFSNNNKQVYENCSSSTNGINVLLFPWFKLCPSDVKTMILIQDSLKVLKSTRRCCRFIRDVFLRDFPADIFLNRPVIIKTLLAISDGEYGGHPEEALYVLLRITESLRESFLKLFSLDLISHTCKYLEDHNEAAHYVNIELENIAGEPIKLPQDDELIALRQMPAPIFALDAAHIALSLMTRTTESGTNDDMELYKMKELNITLSLVENAIELLLDCVNEYFWSTEHTSKIHRDIAHKACMVMRMLGELLTKYRLSYYKNPEHENLRIAWLKLVQCGVTLLSWARSSSLPPSSLVTALQAALLDPALDLMYPSLVKKIVKALLNTKLSVDQEYKSKYRELNKLFASMDHAIQCMKMQNGNQLTKNILPCIKHALPVLYLNLNKHFLSDMASILLKKSKDLDLNDSDWSIARSIALTLMAHNVEWVRVTFYEMLYEMVKSVLMDDEGSQAENEKCLTLICDVGILTEICCHGLSSSVKEVEYCSSEIMLYLLRGRLVLSESCWWRLLASLLPILPLIHVYAEHDTQLGKAICKSLEPDIVECMGVSRLEMFAGLIRLMFVNCAAVQLDAVHNICRLLDDNQYLPPRETLRTDIIMNAIRRIVPQDFNIDHTSSLTKNIQTSGLVQVIDVLKQDLILDEDSAEYVAQKPLTQPALEPSLRRSTLQQLAVIMRQPELHETFLQCDGLNLIVSLLRLSLMVDDYLAFPECAISCVSILNSICFVSRHTLAKIHDLQLLLMRVILVFPANDNTVLMVAQVLSLVAWSGFALQELDSSRQRIPALPFNVTQRTSLPFLVKSYWNISPNTEHSSVEWLLSEDSWGSAVRVRWWWISSGGPKLLRLKIPKSPVPPPSSVELAALRAACLQYSCSKYLLELENATSHGQVNQALHMLEGYTNLISISPTNAKELGSLPWHHTRRFLSAPPASSRDTELLLSLLQFIIKFMDNAPKDEENKMWIMSSFIGTDATIISLLSQDRLYINQTQQDDIEFVQLRIHVVKVLLRCILHVEQHGEYSCSKMESMLKILLSCLERMDLKNFHILGYLNELLRCVRYAIHSRYCKLSEDTLIQSLHVMTNVLSGCTSGAGRKGQACRLDAMLSLLALLRKIYDRALPFQRWSEVWNSNAVRAVVKCSTAEGTELRAAALYVIAALTQHIQLMPKFINCVPQQSLIQLAIAIFSQEGEANVVRAAAASLLTYLTARTSQQTQMLEREVLQTMEDNNFIEECLHIFINYCNDTENRSYLEPNVPLSVLGRKSELEVRMQKNDNVLLSPHVTVYKPAPTAALVAALADVLHNVTSYKSAPVQVWNEQGVYRVLFRCAIWSRGSSLEMNRTRTSTCRALASAALIKGVRTSLAATKDCLYKLIVTLSPIKEDEYDKDFLSSRSQSLYLLAALLPEKSASDVVWEELKNQSTLLDLILYALETEYNDLQEAAMHCLTQLARSILHKKAKNESKEESWIEFLNDLKLPNIMDPKRRINQISVDSANNDCQPEYMVEEISKVLIDIYRHYMEKQKGLSSQEEKWTLVSSCLCSLLSVSLRARMYCVHRHFARTLLMSLQTIRDTLLLQSKPVELIRNADHEPILNTLNWVLTLTTCLMLECTLAKERIADDLATSVIRLWHWTMMTENLRDSMIRLLVTFTNDCPRAWASMCSCVGGRSLLNEICSLVNKEAGRPRPTHILQLSFRILRHSLPHHHCRTVIIKNEVINCICKLRARSNSHSFIAGNVEWLKLCEALSRYPDGAVAVLGTVALPALKPTPARLLPALANAAHHQRLFFLQSPDLLELLSGCLLTGDTADIVSAARAVWALAANNHRAKLVLRSAGIPSAVQTTVQRLQKSPNDVASQRALELLTYTHTILQTS